ncbi:MAG: TonB-dependent receptor [Colwellia sp.]|nr:TonB-dependent receptor [Colwellia sp.]
MIYKNSRSVTTPLKKVAHGILLSLAMPALMQPALAQENESKELEDDSGLEKIVVTASKRAQSLHDVAITVNVMTEERLEAAQVERVSDLQFSVPGLNINTFTGNTQVFIRGVGSNVFGLGADNSIAVYVDGAYVSRQSMMNQEFTDIGRIEVLKGPQAALYGRNATGGAINIVSKAPSETFDFSADARFSNYDGKRYRASVNGAITESLFGRISVLSSAHDGYTEVLSPGFEDVDSVDNFGVKTALRYLPTDDFDIILRYDYFEEKGSGPVAVSTNPFDPQFSVGGGQYDEDPRKIYVNHPSERPTLTERTNLQLNWYLDWADFTSTTTYSDIETGPDMSDDDSSDVTFVHNVGSTLDSKVWTQDFLLTGATDNIEWLLGASYFDESANALNSFQVFIFQPFLFDSQVTNTLENQASAIFGEATYEINEQWRVTLGGRYSDESKEFSILEFGQLEEFKEDWDNFSAKFGLQYFANEDLMVYFNLQEGFKSGGFNLQTSGNSFDPETVLSYELGMKQAFLDNQLSLNSSVYFYDYQDMQVRNQVLGNQGLELFIDNAGKSELYGAEIELQYSPVRELLLGGSIAYSHTEFVDNTTIVNPDLIPPFTFPEDLSPYRVVVDGNSLPKAPELSASLWGQYTLALGDAGSLNFNFEYYYQSSSYHSAFEDVNAESDSYDNLNASIRFDSADDHWHVTLYGRNLTDELAVADIAPSNPLVGTLSTYLPPRTYGIELKYTY